MRRPTILLADDHLLFVEGIVRILKERFDVIGTVTDGGLLFDATSRLCPDIIVSDISMPTLSGFEGLQQLMAGQSRSRLIFLTMHADAQLVVEAFHLGARGYVLKQDSGGELVHAIEIVLQGQLYIPPALCEDVLTLMSQGVTRSEGQPATGRHIKEIAPTVVFPLRRPTDRRLN
jgi:DNA-binding NarL/FixJ family response regulator